MRRLPNSLMRQEKIDSRHLVGDSYFGTLDVGGS
jgi:hypothetical protein